MLKIVCVNSRCRMDGIDLDVDGVEPLPETCLSCRQKLKKTVKLDMGMGVELHGTPLPTVIPTVGRRMLTPELWGKSVLQTIDEANKTLDSISSMEDSCVAMDRRIMDMAEDSSLTTPPSMAEVIAEAGKVLDEAEVPTEGRGIYQPDSGIVEWMEGRDSINESFINLLEHSRRLGAFHIESKLMEMNRELLAVLSAQIDDEDDAEFYSRMP